MTTSFIPFYKDNTCNYLHRLLDIIDRRTNHVIVIHLTGRWGTSARETEITYFVT